LRPRFDTASILAATTKGLYCRSSPLPTFNINFPHDLFLTLYPVPQELRNPGLWPDRPVLLPTQLYGRLETDAAYRDISGVRHPDYQGLSSLFLQDPTAPGLFVLSKKDERYPSEVACGAATPCSVTWEGPESGQFRAFYFV
jgi:hypothetical protein